jgi:hypothetical protein
VEWPGWQLFYVIVFVMALIMAGVYIPAMFLFLF